MSRAVSPSFMISQMTWQSWSFDLSFHASIFRLQWRNWHLTVIHTGRALSVIFIYLVCRTFVKFYWSLSYVPDDAKDRSLARKGRLPASYYLIPVSITAHLSKHRRRRDYKSVHYGVADATNSFACPALCRDCALYDTVHSDEASGSSDFKRTDIEHSIAERGSDHFQFFF